MPSDNLVSVVKPTITQIKNFEDVLSKLPQKEAVVNHYFPDGIYAREIHMKAGMVVVGKIHKESHLNIISKGKLIVSTDKGIEELNAPYTFISPRGTKRVLRVIEDVVWTTIHLNPSNTEDLDKLEDLIITPYNQLKTEDKSCLG
jgi:hypothetical protein